MQNKKCNITILNVIIGFLFLFLFLPLFPFYGLSEAIPDVHTAPNVHQSTQQHTAPAQEQHIEEKAHTEEHHGTPVTYYVYWIILTCAFWQLLKHKTNQKKEDKMEIKTKMPHETSHHSVSSGIPKLLIFLVISMFFMENFSSLAHYHESVGTGLLRFGVEMITGTFLMLYGLSFRHD